MVRLSEFVERQTISSGRIANGEIAITPQAQTLTFRWPYGGFVWNRPVGVMVEQDGQTERIPIIDITRMAQWWFLGLSVIFISVTILLSIQQRRKRNERKP